MAKEMSIQEYIERHPEKDAFATVMFVHQSALIQMSSRIEVLNNELSHIYTYNPIEYVKTRLKTPESIMKKLKKQGRGFQIPALLENVNDIAGAVCPMYVQEGISGCHMKKGTDHCPVD